MIPILYVFSIFAVAITAKIPEYSNFLTTVTQENGVFEILSTICLLATSFYGLFFIYLHHASLKKNTLVIIILMSLLTFFAAMEEISWGQHIFHFPSNDYFMQHNIQQETNLHNFMDANLFSSIIYINIYIMLVFIPLLTKTFLSHIHSLQIFNINKHFILIILFSSSLQKYFYHDFGVYMDMLAHFAGLMFFAYVLFQSKNSLLLKMHYLVVLLSTFIFISYRDVFSFFNMQYEMREMFVTLAVFFIYIEFLKKHTNKKDKMSYIK